jgi:hypothetical protein
MGSAGSSGATPSQIVPPLLPMTSGRFGALEHRGQGDVGAAGIIPLLPCLVAFGLRPGKLGGEGAAAGEPSGVRDTAGSLL